MNLTQSFQCVAGYTYARYFVHVGIYDRMLANAGKVSNFTGENAA